MRVLYHTCVVDVERSDTDLRGVVVQNKGGRGTINAGVVVDATGDAGVAVRAGVPFQVDRNAQAMTTTFMLGNVDTENTVGNQELTALLRRQLNPAGTSSRDTTGTTAGCPVCQVWQH